MEFFVLVMELQLSKQEKEDVVAFMRMPSVERLLFESLSVYFGYRNYQKRKLS